MAEAPTDELYEDYQVCVLRCRTKKKSNKFILINAHQIDTDTSGMLELVHYLQTSLTSVLIKCRSLHIICCVPADPCMLLDQWTRRLLTYCTCVKIHWVLSFFSIYGRRRMENLVST